MREIQLTQGKVALVDNADFEWLNQYKWHARLDNGNWYAKRHPSLLMHRVILNPPKGYECDHIDGNGLNNQRCNLRICSNSQNRMNSNGNRNSSSKYKGVTRNKRGGKWAARIILKGKLIHLGYFTSEIDAAKAYNKAAIEYFGEFARLNEVSEEG